MDFTVQFHKIVKETRRGRDLWNFSSIEFPKGNVRVPKVTRKSRYIANNKSVEIVFDVEKEDPKNLFLLYDEVACSVLIRVEN